MSKDTIQAKIDDISEYFKKIDQNQQAKLIDQITAEIAKFNREENNENDFTDGAFYFLSELVESVPEDLEELIGVNNKNKKKLFERCQRCLHCY